MFGSWQTFEDNRGLLVPIEFDQLDFIPRRMFYVTGVPQGEKRGNHAHYTTQQILTCVQGEIEVSLHDGKILEIVTLQPNQWVFVDRMVWDSQKFMTGHDILMCVCSTVYKKRDYIEDFETFKKLVNS